MSTTQQDKPGAKQRQRNRKTDQRNQKSEQKAARGHDQGRINPIVAPIEAAPVEAAPVETAPVEAAPIDVAPTEAASVAMAMEETAAETAVKDETVPPQIPVPNAVGLQAIAQAQSDYTRKSLQAGRSLVERMITVRRFDEAVEVQSEFAKQTYVNFIAQSQKIGELYGDLAKQFFKPFASGRGRFGR
jgi:hypothetical protein